MNFEKLKSQKCFSGHTVFAEHASEITKTNMKFSYFMPEGDKPKSVLIWLSGLTCNEENFMTKAGAQKFLAKKNMMVICPDTSPRGLELPDEYKSYDFGSGAGFYVNATTDGYKDHYRMYDYIVKELYPIARSFGSEQIGLSGHSMGGHGALVIGLKEAQMFSSVSAFSPIVNPTQVPWGQKAFAGYLGAENQESWHEYDATSLVLSGKSRNKILISQGLNDEFLEDQLKTSHFEKVCQQTEQELEVNHCEGYDHSYYFISTYIEKHIDFHASTTG